jgi:ribosomal protein L11 methyltransferase
VEYIELQLLCTEDFREVFIAELAQIGFESFMETDEGIMAYIPEDAFRIDEVEEIRIRYIGTAEFTYSAQKMARVNWNEEWEKNYDAIDVEGQVYIRATFHPQRPEIPFEIVVNPKMSFGTGHHATTWQMVKLQLDIDHKGKKVLDIGCGTGILAILAAKLGALSIEGFDIDDWAVENSIENAKLNEVEGEFKKGTLHSLHYPGPYDILLANINKAVLTEEIPKYAQILAADGYLLISGFYQHDIADLMEVITASGLKPVKQSLRNDWAAMVLRWAHRA